MPSMKVSLHGMFARIKHALKHGDHSAADYYSFSLDELEKHLKETVKGEHTLEEFAEHYCLTEKAP